MFTGIIESLGTVKNTFVEGSNLRIEVESSLAPELKIDQSVAHNGVCLTVESLNEKTFEVVAVKETLMKTNLANLAVGSIINLERCMQMNGRLDGHIVQGHVDEVATVSSILEEAGSWIYEFQLSKPSQLIVEKGSICINGVSLTAFNVKEDRFTVTIIPYTYENTMFKSLKVEDKVNIEFDIVGKYIQRMVNR